MLEVEESSEGLHQVTYGDGLLCICFQLNVFISLHLTPQLSIIKVRELSPVILTERMFYRWSWLFAFSLSEVVARLPSL